MLKRILEKVEKHRFYKTIEQVKNTKPIDYIYNEEITIVSMVEHNAVSMYLIAIKSFISHFGYGSIEIINDGSLTDDDIQTLKYHIPKITITHINDVETYSCPNDVSWKRLFRIANLIKSSYVIQLDSDVIVTGPMVEISNMVNDNRGFAVGNIKWAEPVDTYFLHAIVKQWNNHHVQSVSELHLKDIDFFKSGTKYIRGCAGFSGYPRQSFEIEDILKFSTHIENIIGREKWSEWGSEQVTSLCLISKSKNSSILPWPKYQNYKFPKTNESFESTSLIHFIGTNRFSDNTYRKLCQNFIDPGK